MTNKAMVIRFAGTILTMLIFVGNLSLIHSVRLLAAPKVDMEAPSDSAKVVNVNKATAEDLETVQGIGPTLAQRIIQYREENGPFKQADDLVNVSGIGGAKLQKIKNQVTV